MRTKRFIECSFYSLSLRCLSFNQNKRKEVPIPIGFFPCIDIETVCPGCSEYINAAGFHNGPYLGFLPLCFGRLARSRCSATSSGASRSSRESGKGKCLIVANVIGFTFEI